MTLILTEKYTTEKNQKNEGNMLDVTDVKVEQKGFMIKGQVISAVDGRNIINTDLEIYNLYDEKVATARTNRTGRFALTYDGSGTQLKVKVLAPDCGVYGLEKTRKVFDSFTIQLEKDRKEYTTEIFQTPFKVNVMEAAFEKVEDKDVLINTPARYIFRKDHIPNLLDFNFLFNLAKGALPVVGEFLVTKAKELFSIVPVEEIQQIFNPSKKSPKHTVETLTNLLLGFNDPHVFLKKTNKNEEKENNKEFTYDVDLSAFKKEEDFKGVGLPERLTIDLAIKEKNGKEYLDVTQITISHPKLSDKPITRIPSSGDFQDFEKFLEKNEELKDFKKLKEFLEKHKKNNTFKELKDSFKDFECFKQFQNFEDFEKFELYFKEFKKYIKFKEFIALSCDTLFTLGEVDAHLTRGHLIPGFFLFGITRNFLLKDNPLLELLTQWGRGIMPINFLGRSQIFSAKKGIFEKMNVPQEGLDPLLTTCFSEGNYNAEPRKPLGEFDRLGKIKGILFDIASKAKEFLTDHETTIKSSKEYIQEIWTLSEDMRRYGFKKPKISEEERATWVDGSEKPPSDSEYVFEPIMTKEGVFGKEEWEKLNSFCTYYIYNVLYHHIIHTAQEIFAAFPNIYSLSGRTLDDDTDTEDGVTPKNALDQLIFEKVLVNFEKEIDPLLKNEHIPKVFRDAVEKYRKELKSLLVDVDLLPDTVRY